MDRLSRTLAGIALTLTLAGCHNVRDKVPPQKAFSNAPKVTANDANPVEFSTKPHDPSVTAAGLIGSAPGNVGPASTNPIASTTSAGNAYGNLTGANKFGGPGTAGLGAPPSMAPATEPSYPPKPPAREDSSNALVGQNPDAPSPF